MKVLAFSGSLRTGSVNERLLAVAVKGLVAKGVEVDVWNFKAATIPVYDPDTSDANPPAAMVDFKARLRASTGLLIACPEYNYSYPGSLKNLLDFASRPPAENPFKGRVSAQLGATPGPGGTLRDDSSPWINQHAVAPGSSSTRMLAPLGACDEPGLVFDGPSSKQRLPMSAPGGLGECCAHHNQVERRRVGQGAVVLGEPNVVTDR
jgi:multimeric flavodoxin WrbA